MVMPTPGVWLIESDPDTRSPRVFFLGPPVMINRYLLALICSVLTLCGLLVAWWLFLNHFL